MTSAYVLIAAVLVLGALLAVAGDRIGTKVGKARLRIFNLRPRNSATLITILTGTVIAASTLGILFATSKSLRQGIFRLDDILKQLRTAQAELNSLSTEKAQVEESLDRVSQEKRSVEQGLNQVQRRYQQATEQAKRLQGEINKLRQQRETLLQQIPQLQAQVRERDRRIAEQGRSLREQQGRLSQLRIQRNELQLQRNTLRQQRNQLQSQRNQLQTEIRKRDTTIQTLDKTIADSEVALQEREENLKELTNQLQFLRQEVAALEQYYQDYRALREGNLALLRGEVLSFGVVKITQPSAARNAVDELLRDANRAAIEATRPFTSGEPTERVVLITQGQVEQLIEEIDDGEEYVVRILSAGNYVEQEEFVRVFADVVANEQVFEEGEVIAKVSVEPDTMSQDTLEQRLDTLLAAAQFRARRAGVVGDIRVEEGDVSTFTDFLELLNNPEEPLEQISAIALNPTNTSGPLKIRLLALRNGDTVFSTARSE
ncbi:DUF3084 domain-containing protein [Spirulina sp. CS-785/01]|uniref:DUF3084 domain-containing protein n=1 Tax=Spirulina sp. CS-785/01 TaxID=3021716 RepID=UPI002330148E|nr:DUF3084 domain-containing protein [Spirulina sp. CS-785/01]MDB9315999.1 DUF3084 domain-containing protein [Spirulina sp. CS-785/01]